MKTVLQDAVHGFRLLLKKPGFMVIATLSLALGIGANTVIFSLINTTLLRPLGFPPRIKEWSYGPFRCSKKNRGKPSKARTILISGPKSGR